MSLDAYLAQHTSEDNASFARLQVRIEEKEENYAGSEKPLFT
jgi:hypothetical protein